MSVSVSRTVSKGTTSSSQKQLMSPQYPQFPDVVLKKLPFYILGDVLLKPSSLQPQAGGNRKLNEQTFTLSLSAGQSRKVSSSRTTVAGRQEFRYQVQLRLCLLETTCEQSDNFPKSLSVKVNGKLCPLPTPLPSQPGTEPRRPPGPLNITSQVKLTSTGPNTLTVSWATEANKAFTVSVYTVESLSHQDLLTQLKDKGVRKPDYTRALIKEKLNDQDSEIATTSCKVSLACPLGKNRMRIPARASTCDHLQCFDAQTYLMMNERKPKWNCPVCNKLAEPISLQIDGFFQDLVKSPRLEEDEHEIVLHNDGTWDPLTSHSRAESKLSNKRKQPTPSSRGTKRPSSDVDCITLEETSDPVDLSGRSKKSKPSPEIECIDID